MPLKTITCNFTYHLLFKNDGTPSLSKYWSSECHQPWSKSQFWFGAERALLKKSMKETNLRNLGSFFHNLFQQAFFCLGFIGLNLGIFDVVLQNECSRYHQDLLIDCFLKNELLVAKTINITLNLSRITLILPRWNNRSSQIFFKAVICCGFESSSKISTTLKINMSTTEAQLTMKTLKTKAENKSIPIKTYLCSTTQLCRNRSVLPDLSKKVQIRCPPWYK